jgi:hypothetical protein
VLHFSSYFQSEISGHCMALSICHMTDVAKTVIDDLMSLRFVLAKPFIPTRDRSTPKSQRLRLIVPTALAVSETQNLRRF